MRQSEGNLDFTSISAGYHEMLRHSYDRGVNYFDTAFFYCHENSEIAVGKALRLMREKVMISTKCPLENIDSCESFRAQFMKSLNKLDSGYSDFYHFWGINKKVFDEKILLLNLIAAASAGTVWILRPPMLLSFQTLQNAIGLQYQQ